MILVHIISIDKEHAEHIVRYLLEEKLILQASLLRKKMFELEHETGEPVGKERTLIICKTKALLFDIINNALRKRFPDNMPLLYAIPIVYMDEKQTTWLRNNTAKV